MANIQELKNVLQGCCGFNYDIVSNYDFTQDDSMDESGSGGAWDLAGIVADDCLSELYENESVNDEQYQNAKDKIQSLLYSLFCTYKTETGDK